MNDRRIMGFIGDRIAKGFGEGMRIHLIISAVILLFSAMPVAAQLEDPIKVCPGTYTGRDHPACPAAETLGWVDCPAQWFDRKGGVKKLRYGELYYRYDEREPNVYRRLLDLYPEGGQMMCQYGSEAEYPDYRQIVEVPGPMIQWGWHQTAQGRVTGVRVTKDLAAKPPVIYVVENISERTNLHGFHLGMTRGEVSETAMAADYTVAISDNGDMALTRNGKTLTIGFGPSGHSRQVTVPVPDSKYEDLLRELSRRFGLEHRFDLAQKPPRGKTTFEYLSWYSRDQAIAVRMHLADVPRYEADFITLMRMPNE